MAITRVQSAKANSGASLATTLNLVFGASPTAGNIVVLSFAGGAGITAITGTGITWLASSVPVAGVATSIAYGIVGSGASSTIAITFASTGAAVVGAEYSGTNIRPELSTSATGSSTSPASGATGTTGTANELWIGALASRNSPTFSSPTGSFSIVDQDKSSIATSNDHAVALLEQIVSATGTPNAGATLSGSNSWAAQVMTFREVTSGGTTAYAS